MQLSSTLPTVIIPAYNEASVIQRLLSALEPGVLAEKFQVVVACNGCKDNTVALVKANYPNFACLDIHMGSKINALNQAEALSIGFPRVYIDADVCISAESVTFLIEQSLSFGQKPALIAPRANIKTQKSSYLVRVFYFAWMKTVFYVEQGFGSGVYVLNRAAREKFGVFPNIIADDGLVREVLQADQIYVCDSQVSTVEAPRQLKDLINIKTRSKLGNMQLDALGLSRPKNPIRTRFLSSLTLPERIIYTLINSIAKFEAKRKFLKMENYNWQRDESSR